MNKIYTEEVMTAIPLWIAGGATKVEIADALGVSVASLEVVCSIHKISLKRQRISVSSAALILNSILRREMSETGWNKLVEAAAARGVTPGDLAVTTVDCVLSEGILESVLDEDWEPAARKSSKK